MLTKFRCRAALLGATAAIGTLAFTAVPASAGVLRQPFKNWVVSGSLTPKKLGEPVNLPKGSTFNGKAEISFVGNFEHINGTLAGAVNVPPFTATIPLLGLIPTTVGVTFEEVGPANGTVVGAPSSTCTGDTSQCVDVNVPTKINIGITSLGTAIEAAGIGVEPSLPTHCETSEPISFDLNEHVSLFVLAIFGPEFAGTTTIPSMKCTGPEGLVLETVLTALMSGPENAYALKIGPPGM